MREPPIPSNERARLATLHALDILDTAPEERFDRYTRLAKRLFRVPIALVSLVDGHRQWFKSKQGLDADETPREISFCGHAITERGVLVVEDALADERFADNPLVLKDPHIRFYAGCPIAAPDGNVMGTLCIIDREPRVLGVDDIDFLKELAEMIEQEFAARRLATIDELTGVANRRGFMMVAEHALAHCQRHDQSAALAYLDLDGFKEINDTYGHEEGDRALIEFVELLKETFRESDVVARLGGDEFCVLATNVLNDEVQVPLKRLARDLEVRNRDPRYRYPLRYSVGTVTFDPGRHGNLADLMREADQLMYECKRARRAVA